MADLNALNAIFSARNGVWASFMVLVLLAWRGWPHVPAIISAMAARRAAIQAAKDSDWTRLREEVERYAARLQVVEEHDQDCQRQLTGALGRLAELEGYMMGQGKARQDAAAIVAAERLIADRDAGRDSGK